MKKLAITLILLVACAASFVLATEREYSAGATDKTVTFVITDANNNRKTSMDDVTNVRITYYIEGATDDPNSVSSAGSLSAHSDWSLAHIYNGMWQLDLPDAAIASEGKHVTIDIDPNGQDFNDVTLTIAVVDPNYWTMKYSSGPIQLSGDGTSILTDSSNRVITHQDPNITLALGSGFNTSTDSLEAIRNRGDAAWTGSGEIDTGAIADEVVVHMDANSTIASEVTAVLLDTGTTIPGTITTAQADLDIITGAAGVVIADDSITAAKIATDAITADELSAAGIAEIVTAVWAQTMSDLSAGNPVVTEDVLAAITRIWLANFGKVITNGTNNEVEYYNDAGTKIAEAPIADDGTDFTKDNTGAND